MGSTLLNENFSYMVSSKAPKRLYYGVSESLRSRVSASVCQKMTVISTLQRCGETYQSKIALQDHTDLQDIDLKQDKVSPDHSPMMFFDLETTGLARTSDILQIAAVSGDEEMNVYMRPTTQICLEASAATGMTYIGGVLKHKGQTVTSVSPEDGLRYFLEFLKKISKPILVGHNVQNFDVPVLVNQLAKYGLLEHFKENVSGFLDTLKLGKKIWKKGIDVENYKQETLVKSHRKIEYDAHNAVADVQSLMQLYEKKMSDMSSSDDVYALSYYACKSSLDSLVESKVISSQTLKKLVDCSLSLSKLRCIHKRDPYNGIRNVFSERSDGTKIPRVSKSKIIIDKVVAYMNAQ